MDKAKIIRWLRAEKKRPHRGCYLVCICGKQIYDSSIDRLIADLKKEEKP